MSSPKVPRRLQRIVATALAAGWRYDVTGKGHPRLRPPPGTIMPDGRPCVGVTFSLTPSDGRGDKNSVGRLRRAGLQI